MTGRKRPSRRWFRSSCGGSVGGDHEKRRRPRGLTPDRRLSHLATRAGGSRDGTARWWYRSTGRLTTTICGWRADRTNRRYYVVMPSGEWPCRSPVSRLPTPAARTPPGTGTADTPRGESGSILGRLPREFPTPLGRESTWQNDRPNVQGIHNGGSLNFHVGAGAAGGNG